MSGAAGAAGAGGALGAIGSIWGGNIQQGGANTGRDAYAEQMQKAMADLEKYYGAGKDELNAGFNEGLGFTNPYLQGDQAAYGGYLSSLGVMGQEAQQKSFDTFRANPGYQFSMDQGLKSLDKSAAARGLNKSGTAIKGALGFSQGLADQEFGKYQDRLMGISEHGRTLASETAGRRQQLGSDQASHARWRADTGGGYYSGIGTSNANAEISGADARARGITGAFNKGSDYLSTKPK